MLEQRRLLKSFEEQNLVIKEIKHYSINNYLITGTFRGRENEKFTLSFRAYDDRIEVDSYDVLILWTEPRLGMKPIEQHTLVKTCLQLVLLSAYDGKIVEILREKQ